MENIRLFSSDKSAVVLIVCNNTSEQAYLLDWCERKGKDVSDWMHENSEFPIAYSCEDKVIGFTRFMDRAIGYKEFKVFYNQLMDGVN